MSNNPQKTIVYERRCHTPSLLGQQPKKSSIFYVNFQSLNQQNSRNKNSVKKKLSIIQLKISNLKEDQFINIIQISQHQAKTNNPNHHHLSTSILKTKVLMQEASIL